MPAQVSVNVKVDDAVAKGQLLSLEKQIDALNKKGVNIKVNVNGNGSGGIKGATKEVQELSSVLTKAGYDIDTVGKKVKETTSSVNGEITKTTATFKQGVGETVKATSTGAVTVTKNFEAMEKAATKSQAALTKTLKGIAQVGVTMAVAFTLKNVKEALGTMKEVDKELANIRKVTDQSAEAIQKLGRRSYDAASRYGVSATDYLKNAASFAKAGFKNYADMSELAIKTQLVGDVTADVASKFLLSANAAYKYGGNIEELSLILDKANYIENNYATSIEKMAEGFPIVASTASMANVSVEELIAALGTITSVTQETGRKAATALRALILNITGEVGAVIDEDLTVTQKSVNSMSDALKKYGSDAIKAAKATGDLIDPLEAIRSLSEAYKKGDLSRSELFGILTDVGGKLRTNQLAALVENFEMFEEMLYGIEDAAGSADKELSTMMETWDVKANQLKNTWTELVADVINTDSVKGGIDLLTQALEGIDEAVKTTSAGFLWANNFYNAIKDGASWEEASERAQAAYNDRLSDFVELEEEALKAAQNLNDENELTADGYDGITEAVDDATAAVERFKNATTSNKEDAAQGYSSAYKKFLEDWTAGKTDTNVVNAAFDMFFTPEMQQAMGFSMQAMGELLASDLYKGIFNGTTGDAGVDFANYIRDHMTEALAEITKITTNADGTFNFEYASAEKLAEYFKLPLPAIEALLGALDNYGVEVEMGWEDTQNLADSLKSIGVNADGTGDSIQSVADGLVQLGNTDAKKISSMISELAKIGFIKGFENLTPEQIGDAISKALSSEEGEVPEIPVDVAVNPEQAQEAVQEAVSGATGGQTEAKATVTLEITNPGNVPELANALDSIEGVEVEVRENGAVEATVEVEALQEAIDAIGDKDVSVVAYTNGISNLEYLKNLIDTITSKTININIPSTGGGDSGGSSSGGRPNEDSFTPTASGTKNAPGGKTLVNELGPELISDNGVAYIANGGKPAVVNLSKGAIVLTAPETKSALNYKGKGSRVRAAASGIPSSGGSSGGGGAIEYFEDEDSTIAVGVSEPADMSERKDWLEKFLKQIDANIEYQHNLKHHNSEADHYIQLAIDNIKQIRDEYIRNGYAVDSTEVAELANKIFDYEKDLQDAKKHAIEDLDDELDNLDARIQLAENQNDVRRALELEQEAQRRIAELIQQYRDAGFSDTSDEILSLVNKGYKYSGESESRLKQMREELLDTIKAIQKNQEEEDDLAEKQKAVEEGREAVQNAYNQRTVRVFNPVTGQWEWVANAADIKSAEENLANAEKALSKEQQSRELAALEKALGQGLGLENITLGPALAAMISHASLEQQADVTQALGMLTGGIVATADTSAKSIFDSVDSHDTINQFYFEGLSIGAEIAGVTTLAELANLLVGNLAITDNMPG